MTQREYVYMCRHSNPELDVTMCSSQMLLHSNHAYNILMMMIIIIIIETAHVTSMYRQRVA